MKYVLFAIMVVSLLFAGVAAASHVEDKQHELIEVNEQIDKTKDELEQINERQKRTAREIDSINMQQLETTSEIDSLNAQINLAKDELTKIEADLLAKTFELESLLSELQVTRQEIEDINVELKNTVIKTEQQEDNMSKRVRVMFMNRTSSYIELILQAKSINELFHRLEIVRSVVAFDNEVLEKLKLYRSMVDAQKASLLEKEIEISNLAITVSEQKDMIEHTKYVRSELLSTLSTQQRDYEDLLTRLEDQERRRNRALANLESEEESYERQLDELERTSEQLERKIQELIRQQNERERQAEFTGGLMQWPVPGFYRITSPFGYRVHPVFGTRRMHAGIDIGSNIIDGNRQSIYGRNFVAAADGVVILAGIFGGYGNTVILDHGGEITTLYAHGSRILVSEGDRIAKGTPVMTVGSTGISTGAHAHFEVRVNGSPVDPMPYLRTR